MYHGGYPLADITESRLCLKPDIPAPEAPTAMPHPATLPPFYGTEVSGAAFWPRPGVIDPLVKSLAVGQSHTLFGLRRIGKSSVLAEARRRLEAQGVLVSSVVVEGGSGLEGVFGALLRNLPATDLQTRLLKRLDAATGIAAPVLNGVRGWLKGFGLPVPERDLESYWPAVSRALRAGLAEHPGQIVLMIDELPFLLQNTLAGDGAAGPGRGLAAARAILAELREWRRLKQVSMLVAGSIGLRALALRHHLDPGAFNDMTPIALPPLDAEEARRMVAALAAGAGLAGWTPATTETLLDGLPEFHAGVIQLAFQQVWLRWPMPAEAIRTVLHNHFEPALIQQFFSQFQHRVQREAAPLQAQMVRAIDLAVDAGAAGVPPQAMHDALARPGGEDPAKVVLLLQEEGFLAFDLRAGVLRPACRLVTAWRHATPRPRG
jgi:hypothetical protein